LTAEGEGVEGVDGIEGKEGVEGKEGIEGEEGVNNTVSFVFEKTDLSRSATDIL